MKFPVFDLHCDTANELIGKGYNPKCELKSNQAHIDLERATAFDGYAQCFACFTTYDLAEDIEALFNDKMNAVLSQVQKNSDIIRQAFCANDIEQNKKDGYMSAILTIEGPCGFGFDPARLEELRKIGFLFTTLGWNEKNVLTGSNATGGGLSDLGKEYVKEAQRLGMIIDVSHISDEGFWDIINMTNAPVVATHSNSRALCAHRRNLTDDMFKAICSTNGTVGINLYKDFLGSDPDLDTVCDHIFHFLELDPTAKHISLGGDLDGIDAMPKGFSGLQDYEKIANRLLERGLDEKTVLDIFWNNAIDVLKRQEE